jgi:hypothetical protein
VAVAGDVTFEDGSDGANGKRAPKRRTCLPRKRKQGGNSQHRCGRRCRSRVTGRQALGGPCRFQETKALRRAPQRHHRNLVVTRHGASGAWETRPIAGGLSCQPMTAVTRQIMSGPAPFSEEPLPMPPTWRERDLGTEPRPCPRRSIGTGRTRLTSSCRSNNTMMLPSRACHRPRGRPNAEP